MHRHLKKILLTLLLIFALLLDNAASAYSSSDQFSNSTDTSRVIISFNRATPNFLRHRFLRNSKTLSSRRLALPDSIVVELPSEMLWQTLENSKRNLWIRYAEIDAQIEQFETPNDSYYQQQWNLKKIQVETAWDQTRGEGATVAVLDSGITPNHPDLPKPVSQHNFTWGGGVDDQTGHGTHVAGIIAAKTDNHQGVAGIAPKSGLLIGKVLDSRGRGYYSWLIDALYWAERQNADVINMSLGGTYSSSSLSQAISSVADQGILLVAAAGNSGDSTPHYPAYYHQVIAVGASDSQDDLVSISAFGDWVDIAAPGQSILSTYPPSSFAIGTGTSMASPHVAAVLALGRSVAPQLTDWQLKNFLLESTDPIDAPIKNGRLNAAAFVDSLSPTTSPTPDPSPSDAPPSPSPSPSPTPPPSDATPSPSPSPSPTPPPSDAPPGASPTPTPIPSPSPSPAPPSPSPSPSPTPKPWWCKRIPWSRYCR